MHDIDHKNAHKIVEIGRPTKTRKLHHEEQNDSKDIEVIQSEPIVAPVAA